MESQMNETELRSILHSDFKLWARADTEEDGSTLTKTIELPYNIGTFTLSFKGINNAEGRRNAAGIWGVSIREAVENAIGEESVTARAAQRAAQVSEDDGTHGGLGQPDPNVPKGEATSLTEAVPALSPLAEISTDPSSRLDELRRARDGHRKAAKALDLEISALTAYMEVMNANTQTDETEEAESGV
jgi:hypothetical protein